MKHPGIPPLLKPLALSAAVLILCEVGAHAAPITVTLERRLTSICDIPVFDLADCVPDHSILEFSITYDPDTLVLSNETDGIHLRTTGPLTYTFPIAPLEDPWNGTVERFAYADAVFHPAYRELRLEIHDRDHTQGCTQDGRCFGSWVTTLFLAHFSFDGSPGGVPAAADFEDLLRLPPVRGNSLLLNFGTYGAYIPLGGEEQIYLPGSRLYHSVRDVPEPSLVALLLGAAATGWWRFHQFSIRRSGRHRQPHSASRV